jgi:hypothetical protein
MLCQLRRTLPHWSSPYASVDQGVTTTVVQEGKRQKCLGFDKV